MESRAAQRSSDGDEGAVAAVPRVIHGHPYGSSELSDRGIEQQGFSVTEQTFASLSEPALLLQNIFQLCHEVAAHARMLIDNRVAEPLD